MHVWSAQNWLAFAGKEAILTRDTADPIELWLGKAGRKGPVTLGKHRFEKPRRIHLINVFKVLPLQVVSIGRFDLEFSLLKVGSPLLPFTQCPSCCDVRPFAKSGKHSVRRSLALHLPDTNSAQGVPFEDRRIWYDFVFHRVCIFQAICCCQMA